ncbi:hypothetical protein VPH35_023822 [Triticum aestivum]
MSAPSLLERPLLGYEVMVLCRHCLLTCAHWRGCITDPPVPAITPTMTARRLLLRHGVVEVCMHLLHGQADMNRWGLRRRTSGELVRMPPSIIDGQICLETELFYRAIRPTINVDFPSKTLLFPFSCARRYMHSETNELLLAVAPFVPDLAQSHGGAANRPQGRPPCASAPSRGSPTTHYP